MSMDWGAGKYEITASELEPAATELVRLLEPAAGRRVLDVGCGTGNASLVAARAGAVVAGVDPAARLVEVARQRASDERLDVSFRVGRAEDLPFDADSFDVAISVFGVIFASDPQKALEEMLRVIRSGGEALISVWIPEGAIDAMVGVMRRHVAAATGSGAARFAWHDPEAIAELVGGRASVTTRSEGAVSFVSDSPETYFAIGEEHHPMSIAMAPVLTRAGTYEQARQEAIAALREGNEDPDRFRVTSRYRVIALRPRLG